MNNPLLLFLVPLSFLIALLLTGISKVNLSMLVNAAILAICALLLVPFIFTEYNYGGLYPNTVIITIVSVGINFVWMQYATKNNRIAIGISLCLITFIPTGYIFFGRS